MEFFVSGMGNPFIMLDELKLPKLAAWAAVAIHNSPSYYPKWLVEAAKTYAGSVCGFWSFCQHCKGMLGNSPQFDGCHVECLAKKVREEARVDFDEYIVRTLLHEFARTQRTKSPPNVFLTDASLQRWLSKRYPNLKESVRRLSLM